MKSFHRVRSAAVLLAVAGAVLVSGALPASADSDVTFEPMTVEVIQDPTDPTMPRPTPEPPIVKLFPDLAVTYQNAGTGSTGYTYYHFTVKNNGPVTAMNVKLVKTYSLGNNSHWISDNFTSYEALGSIPGGQTMDVYVTCKPQPNRHCDAAFLKADSGNGDSNANNNTATFSAH